MFMTQNELATLTGYSLPAWQRRWLTKHGWIFDTARNGRVVVLLMPGVLILIAGLYLVDMIFGEAGEFAR